MKKIIFILFAFLLVCNMYGQSIVGIRGGFGISSMSTGGARSRPGFEIGALYAKQITDKWQFQPSLLFSLRGAKSAENHSPGYSAYMYSIESPLMFSLRAGDEDISLGLDIGPFFRYALFGGYWTDSEQGRIKPDIFENQKRFDLGPQIGFSVMANSMYMGYSFQYGLIKPWSEKRGNYYNSSLTFGYLFRIY